MRIVSPEEAVAGIKSRDQVYVQMAAAAPDRSLLEALAARAPELSDVGVIHLHMEGPGPAPGAGDGAPLPPSCPVHRAQRPQAVNEGRADFVPVFFSDIPALFRSRAPTRWTRCSPT